MSTASPRRRRLLYLTHRVPYPPNRGDRIRSYHMLRFLAAHHDVDLACLMDEPVTQDCQLTLNAWCRRTAIVPLSRCSRWLRAMASLARGESATVGLFYSPQLVKVLENWLATTSYDWVIAYCSSMAQYLRIENVKQSTQVVDLVDIDSQKWFDYADNSKGPVSWLFRWEGNRVRKLEQQIAAQTQMQWVVSDAEAQLFREFCPQANVHSVPNGVDLEHFSLSARQTETRPGECVFVGALDYRANVDGVTWFCEQVWPQVHARYPTSKFVIVGRNPTSAVNRLARQPGVEVVGTVPDVLPYLQRGQVVVVPLRIARGIQNKVLEALAVGKPVIASLPALEGLAVVPGNEALAAETPAQWVKAITRLLDDQHECRRLCKAARTFVSTHHNWKTCLERLNDWLNSDEASASHSSSCKQVTLAT